MLSLQNWPDVILTKCEIKLSGILTGSLDEDTLTIPKVNLSAGRYRFVTSWPGWRKPLIESFLQRSRAPLSPNALVNKSQPLHLRWIKQVSAVEHDWMA